MAEVSTSEATWINLYLSIDDHCKPPLLDLRPRDLFNSNHVTNATHFEGLEGPNGLLSRFNELPPPQLRSQIAIVAVEHCQAKQAAHVLMEKGYGDAIVLKQENLLQGLLPITSGLKSRALWAPAPILLEEIDFISRTVLAKTALDIGAGSGRDSAFLALCGYSVTSVDRDKNLVSKAVRLASRENQFLPNMTCTSESRGTVRGIVRTLGAHLSQDRDWLRSNASQLLVVVRFLRRGVLEMLHEAVDTGGFVIYEHFLRGCEQFSGPKKASQMLEMGELGNVFTEERGFSILRDEKQLLADGRPVVRFVAHRNRVPRKGPC